MRPHKLIIYASERITADTMERVRTYMAELPIHTALVLERVVVTVQHQEANAEAMAGLDDYFTERKVKKGDTVMSAHFIAAGQGAFDPWDENLIRVNMEKSGWDGNSIALGFALGAGLRWEDYGSTWSIKDGAVERIDRPKT